MKELCSLPNLITLGRLLLAVLVYGLLLHLPHDQLTILIAFLATLAVIFGDYLDGYFARKTGQASTFGAWFDIAADRMIELGYWLLFISLDLISPWIGLVFLFRGILVDGVRSFASQEGYTAFGARSMMQSKWGVYLVSSRASRVLYAICKAVTFALLVLSLHYVLFYLPAILMTYLSTIFCIIRGVPVLVDGMTFLRHKS